MFCIPCQGIWLGALAGVDDKAFQQLDDIGKLAVPLKFKCAGGLFLDPLSCKLPQNHEAGLQHSFTIPQLHIITK